MHAELLLSQRLHELAPIIGISRRKQRLNVLRRASNCTNTNKKKQQQQHHHHQQQWQQQSNEQPAPATTKAIPNPPPLSSPFAIL